MTNQFGKMSAARRIRRGVAVAIGAVVLLGACSSDGIGPLEGIDVTAPAEGGEPAPDPEPAPDDETSTGTWVALILLGLGAFALIAGAISMASRRSGKKQAAQSAARHSSAEVIGLTRWLVDQGSVDVLRATDVQQLAMAWNSVRGRAVDIENRCQVLASSTGETTQSEALRTLGLAVASLRGALETSVKLRKDPNAPNTQPLIDDNSQTVSLRRQEAQLAMDALSRLMV